jgi:hypothetical protein
MSGSQASDLWFCTGYIAHRNRKRRFPRDGEAPFLLIEQHDGGPGVFCFRQSIRSE